MLAKKTITELEKTLNEREKTIIEELKNFTEKNKEVKGDFQTTFPQYGSAYDENALEVSDYETGLSIEHRLETDLAQINDALEKIKNNNYGNCEKCGQEMDPKRLKAFPEAKFCIDCRKK